MTISKAKREQVYQKYDGHCAYCGKKLEYKDMQVDHIIPKNQWVYTLDSGIDIDDMTNLNPSCRRCNHYKRSYRLDRYRELVKKLHTKILDTYLGKVAHDYGIIKIQPWDGRFYYEKIKQEDEP